jgi:hypothetical protein
MSSTGKSLTMVNYMPVKLDNGCILLQSWDIGRLIDTRYPYYVVVTTYPNEISGNRGDLLITMSFIELFKSMLSSRCGVNFLIIYREESLEGILDIVNSSQGLIFPGFSIGNNTYPGLYRLCSDLRRITVPMYAVGSSQCIIPGSAAQIENHILSPATLNLLKRFTIIGVRDICLRKMLVANGVTLRGDKVVVTGDCGMFDSKMMGLRYVAPPKVSCVVFTEPHSRVYVDQVKWVLGRLRKIFGKRRLIFSKHSRNNKLCHMIHEDLVKWGYEVVDNSGNSDIMNFYNSCDMHIGYRLHGFISFLRLRKPAYLFMEDGRSMGIGATIDPNRTHTICAFKETGVDGNELKAGDRVVVNDKFFELFNGMLKKRNMDFTSIYDEIGSLYNGGMKKVVSLIVQRSGMKMA